MRRLTNILAGLTTEDRIVLLRFVTGLVYGLSVLIASLFVDRAVLSVYAWSTSVLVYYVTIVLVLMKYRPTSRFQLYLRGLGTFYATWLLTSIILHEVLVYSGLRG